MIHLFYVLVRAYTNICFFTEEEYLSIGVRITGNLFAACPQNSSTRKEKERGKEEKKTPDKVSYICMY